MTSSLAIQKMISRAKGRKGKCMSNMSLVKVEEEKGRGRDQRARPNPYVWSTLSEHKRAC